MAVYVKCSKDHNISYFIIIITRSTITGGLPFSQAIEPTLKKLQFRSFSDLSSSLLFWPTRISYAICILSTDW